MYNKIDRLKIGAVGSSSWRPYAKRVRSQTNLDTYVLILDTNKNRLQKVTEPGK